MASAGASSPTARLRDLVFRLRTIPEGEESAPEFVARELAPLIDADITTAYRPDRGPNGWTLGFFHLAGHTDADFRKGLDRFLASTPAQFALYNPERPVPAERNRAIRPRTTCDVEAWRALPLVRDFLEPRRMGELDQLRLLVCDGPALLGWIGGLRKRPFTARHIRLLAGLQPALTARLRLERQLAGARLYWDCLTTTLDSLSAPAFLVVQGTIQHVNASAKPLVDRDRQAVEQTLADATDSQLSRARIAISGVPPIELCILHEPRPDLQRRLEVAYSVWQLSPAERRVLRYLVLGDTNKTIATKLACAEVTVEYHVTRVLRKASVAARTELLARFWTAA
jgi:DNA-binding CsgD family transcriptional regulator